MGLVQLEGGASLAPYHGNLMIGVPLSIGSLDLSSNMLLAPVANYCDLAFRMIARSCGGVGVAYTDLLSPHGLLRGTAQSLDLARTNDADSPIGMQLYGCQTELLCEAALWAIDHGADTIDINMGCPVDKITKKDGGSKLLCDPEGTTRMAAALVETVSNASGGRIPVTAKVRLGWDDERLVAPSLARSLEQVGIAMVTVHGRTTEQRFRGQVRHTGIAEVVSAVDRIPVIGNGDVTTPEKAIEMLERTGCAGVMIGRGSFSAPWLLRDCWALQTTGGVPAEPTQEEKIALIRRYFELMLEFRTQRYAMAHVQRRISWFSKRLGPCKPLKEALRLAETPGDVHRALDEFLAGGLRFMPGRDPAEHRNGSALAGASA